MTFAAIFLALTGPSYYRVLKYFGPASRTVLAAPYPMPWTAQRLLPDLRAVMPFSLD